MKRDGKETGGGPGKMSVDKACYAALQRYFAKAHEASEVDMVQGVPAEELAGGSRGRHAGEEGGGEGEEGGGGGEGGGSQSEGAGGEESGGEAPPRGPGSVGASSARSLGGASAGGSSARGAGASSLPLHPASHKKPLTTHKPSNAAEAVNAMAEGLGDVRAALAASTESSSASIALLVNELSAQRVSEANARKEERANLNSQLELARLHLDIERLRAAARAAPAAGAPGGNAPPPAAGDAPPPAAI